MTLVVVDDDHTSCQDCGKHLGRGSIYSERLLGVIDGESVIERICLTCRTTGVTS